MRDQPVQVLLGDDVVQAKQTDKSGTFRFALAPGDYNVVGWEGCTGQVPVHIETGTSVELTLSCPIP